MYTGSHLKLILAILLIPSIFIFLIIADSENRSFTNDPELTVEKISLGPINPDINIPKESKIKIKLRMGSFQNEFCNSGTCTASTEFFL